MTKAAITMIVSSWVAVFFVVTASPPLWFCKVLVTTNLFPAPNEAPEENTRGYVLILQEEFQGIKIFKAAYMVMI